MIVTDQKALSKPCTPCESLNEGLDIGKKLLDVLQKTKDGVGLAANQIGIDAAVCVINVGRPVILVNPEIKNAFEKIFFPEAMHRIILDKIEEIIEKRIKKKPVKIATRKSLPFKFEKGSFFGRFVKTKLNFSKRYLMKKKLFGIE